MLAANARYAFLLFLIISIIFAPNLSAQQTSTSTTATCTAPGSSDTSTCTATVNGANPTGSVDFTLTAPGVRYKQNCQLPSTTSNTKSCSVQFSSSESFAGTVTGGYGGDSNNQPSSFSPIAIQFGTNSGSVKISASPASAAPGQTVTFTESYQSPYITSVVWDFGDGKTATTTSTSITHAYAAIEQYAVDVTVTWQQPGVGGSYGGSMLYTVCASGNCQTAGGQGGSSSTSSTVPPSFWNYCTNTPAGQVSSTSNTATLDLCAGGACPQSYGGTCHDTQVITTQVTAGTGPLTSTQSSASDASPANQVNQSNAASVPLMLICPQSTFSTSNQGLFYGYPNDMQYQNVLGDACYNKQTKLLTSIDLPTSISWGQYSPARASVGALTFNDLKPASLTITNFGYSPMLESGSGNVLSNGFSTNTYVFGQVPSYAQHGVWTWNAIFANFNSMELDSLTASANQVSVETTNTIQEQCGVGDEPACSTCNVRTGVPSTSSSSSSSSSSSTICASQEQTETLTCAYTYSYSETTQLQNVQNYYIPYTTATKSSDGTTNIEKTFNANVVPYFTYNYLLPGLDGQNLADSYDIFSPWNYPTPVNVIDTFPIDTPNTLFFNYQGTLLSSPASGIGGLSNSVLQLLGNIQTFLQDAQGSIGGLLDALSNHKTASSGLYSPLVANAISISALANDYVLVLNWSNPASSGNGDYYIDVLRLIPHGYFNVTGYQPSPSNPDTPYQAGSPGAWTSGWNSYWSNVITLQDQAVYNINAQDLKSQLGSFAASLGNACSNSVNTASCSDKGYAASGFTPLNMSVSDSGAVFITGNILVTENSGNNYNTYPAIIGLLFPTGSNGQVNWGATPSLFANTTLQWSLASSSAPAIPILNEIASTSTGQIVYGANQTSGYIYQFDGTTLAQSGTIDLAYQSAVGQGAQSTLSISDWLLNGGLFGVKFDGKTQTQTTGGGSVTAFYAGPATQGTQSGGQAIYATNDMDQAAYHHPIGISVVNGYLYVLDNWAGSANVMYSPPGAVGESSYGPGTYFDILVLRALNSQGVDTPINPTGFDDMFSPQSCSATFVYTGLGIPPQTPVQEECITDTQSWSLQCNPSNECQTLYTGCTINGKSGDKFGCHSPSTGEGSQYWTQTPASSLAGLGGAYPPYGWILSANITGMNSLNQFFRSAFFNTVYERYASTPGASNPITFCSSTECTFNPSNMPAVYLGGYMPVGPLLRAVQTAEVSAPLSSKTPRAFESPTYQRTGAAFAPMIYGSSFTINFNETSSMLFPPLPAGLSTSLCSSGLLLGYSCQVQDATLYNELLFANARAENYTNVFKGFQPYTCISSLSQSDSGSCASSTAVNSIAAPVYLVTNPLRYVENLGSAQTQSLASQFYSSFLQNLQNTGCSSQATSSNQCASGGATQSGTPTLSEQLAPVDYGVTDQVTVTATNAGDSVAVNAIDSKGNELGGSPVSSSSQSASVTICGTPPSITPGSTQTVNRPLDCVLPSNSPIAITGNEFAPSDTCSSPPCLASGEPNTYKLSVNQVPFLNIASPIAVQATNTVDSSLYIIPDTAYAVAYNPGDSVTIALTGPNGATVGTSNTFKDGVYFFICPNSGNKMDATCGLSPGQTYTMTATENGKSTSQTLTVQSTSSGTGSSVPAQAETLSSRISGYLVVPYKYTYSISQKSALESGPTVVSESGDASPDSPSSLCAPPSLTQQTAAPTDVYSFALVNGPSGTQTATIEGDYSYLLSTAPTGGYFMPNLSNYGLVVPPLIDYTLQNDRLFGYIYANITSACTTGYSGGAQIWDCSRNNQAVLDSSRLYAYEIDHYAQSQGGFYTLVASSNPGSGPAEVGGASAGSGTATLSYNPLQEAATVTLFEIYKQAVYDSDLALSINSQSYTPSSGPGCSSGRCSTYGYQRITYVMNDRFGNNIYVPMDIDVANTVSLSLTVSSQVNPNNVNQTTITFNGLLGVQNAFGGFTPLPNNDVYLYYNTNLDYADYNPVTCPLDAAYCAYALSDSSFLPSSSASCPLPGPYSCVQSNPVFTTSLDNRYANSQVATYAPSYNGFADASKNAQCNPQPPSLLQEGSTLCNIYGNNGYPNICPATGVLSQAFACYQNEHGSAAADNLASCLMLHSYTYCEGQFPDYATCVNNAKAGPFPAGAGQPQYCADINPTTGAGVCTSQIGLIGNQQTGGSYFTTNAGGAFSGSITACGTEQDSILAAFYGYPAPEPIQAKVVPLGLSEIDPSQPASLQSTIGKSNPSAVIVGELNYSEAPVQTRSSPFQIGLFELSYGDVNTLWLLASVATALLALLLGSTRRRAHGRKARRHHDDNRG
ncbi:MAG: PKD domain-containing protein [Candidatus Micrarchaeota archaeon]|nr:PKD domain-containing protein [Candidatus Micrarchaeota archaeon]